MLVGGVTGVHQQPEVDRRHRVPLRQDDLEAVGQGGALQGGEACRRRLARTGELGAVHIRRQGLVLGEGMHFQVVDAVGQPALRRALQVGGGGARHPRQGRLVEVGCSAVDLVRRQDVGLAAEAADPLDPADEVGPVLRLHAPHLLGRRALGEQAGQLFVDGALHVGQLGVGARRPDDVDLAADLPQVDERVHGRGDLVVVDQPLVEA